LSGGGNCGGGELFHFPEESIALASGVNIVNARISTGKRRAIGNPREDMPRDSFPLLLPFLSSLLC
jgi:hypothetical protein